MYKVLIVDDILINIKLAGKILEKEGNYEITSALSGKEALEKIAVTVPDLILLDALMPDMNGIEVGKIIRKTHSNLDLPIIMITAANEQELKIQALEAGIDEFLGKPIDGVELVTRIKTLLGNREMHHRLQKRHFELMRQMDLAKIIQQKLQSTGCKRHGNMRVEASYFPMYQIGGDIIYMKELADNQMIVFIGDASGHGISAALVSTLIKAILESIPLGATADHSLAYVNNKLTAYFDGNLDDMYVTCLLCIIDQKGTTLDFANAGHPMPLIRKKGDNGYSQLSLPSGPPIGIIEGITYHPMTLKYDNLDEVLLYTDGIFPMLQGKNGKALEEGFTREMLLHIIESRGASRDEEQEDDFAIIRLFMENSNG